MCFCEQSICWRRARPVELPSGPCRRRADSVTGWCDVSTCQPTRARPKLTVKRSSSGEVLSFRPDDVAGLLAAAATPPPPNVRSAWPARDRTAVETLAHCGVRVAQAMAPTDQPALTKQLCHVIRCTAVDDLQKVSRGVHPAILSSVRLGAALRTLRVGPPSRSDSTRPITSDCPIGSR
jgi:hypothetical protein